MRFDTEIHLIKGKVEKAKLSIINKKLALSEKKDASLNAVFSASTSNLKPKYVFTTFKMNFEDENIVLYEGKYYSIWRTYEKDSYIELHVETKAAYENIKVNEDGIKAT